MGATVLSIDSTKYKDHLTRSINKIDTKLLPTYSDTGNTNYKIPEENIPIINLSQVSGKISEGICGSIETFDDSSRVVASNSVTGAPSYIANPTNGTVNNYYPSGNQKFSAGTFTQSGATLNKDKSEGSVGGKMYLSTGFNHKNFASGEEIEFVGLVVGEIYTIHFDNGSDTAKYKIKNTILNWIGKNNEFNRGTLMFSCVDNKGSIVIISNIYEFN